MTPKEIATKLYQTIPLVTTGCIIQDIIQDVQSGLYKDCGDPNKNWNKYKEKCKELLKQRNIVGTRLKKKAYFDAGDRECAMIYIDGQIIEGETHNQALTDYTNSLQIKRRYNGGGYSRDYMDSELKENPKLEDLPFCCLNKVTEDILSHEPLKNIYIETETLSNVTLEQVISAVKSKYPDFIIYKDNLDVAPYEYDEYKRLAKVSRLLKKRVNTIFSKIKFANKIKLIDILDPDNVEDYGVNTDYGNRKSAIVYLNGQVVEGEIHREILEKMTENIKGNSGFVENNELAEIDLPIALASKIDGIDGKEYISIYTDSITKTTLNEVKDAIKIKFPKAIICKEDDRYYSDENSYIEVV